VNANTAEIVPEPRLKKGAGFPIKGLSGRAQRVIDLARPGHNILFTPRTLNAGGPAAERTLGNAASHGGPRRSRRTLTRVLPLHHHGFVAIYGVAPAVLILPNVTSLC
jgi:hypothetical protein